jgi:hypothetical protein
MGIINQHGGGIQVRSRELVPSGTCFSLFFPHSIAADVFPGLAVNGSPTLSLPETMLEQKTA